MTAQPALAPARHYPLPAPAGGDLSRAINTRRRLKCIAQGAHPAPAVPAVKCPRCGL